MNKQEVEKIIEEERLTRINWFHKKELRENQVGIRKQQEKWVVYVTDERASIVEGSETCFDNEGEAYEMLICKGRYAQRRFG